MKKPSDQPARDRALDPTTSFIVHAPAGSGKTTLLTRRYVALLDHAAPESILAITFTRKAAAEMRDRVVSALHSTPHAHLAENPARLAIQTFDSLALRIVSQMPWLARMGAVPAPTEDASPLYLEAARRTMELAAENSPIGEAVFRLLLHADNRADRWMDLIRSLLERRDQWLHWLIPASLDLTEARAAFENSLARLRQAALEQIRTTFGSLAGETLDLAHFAAQTLNRTLAGEVDAWQFAAECFLKKDDNAPRKSPNARQGFPPGTPEARRAKALCAALAGHPGAAEALAEFRFTPPAVYTDGQWQVLSDALAVIKRATAELQLVFRERNAIDFIDLNLAAAHALGETTNPTDLALALGSRFEHILVDEFQDTSRRQFHLLEQLTAGWTTGDGRTLFLVGDPMQSIYAFRQAEVGLFQQARENGIGELKLESLRLTANFRSAPELVHWTNTTFPPVFPSHDDAARGFVAFHPAVAEHPEYAGRIHLHAFIDNAIPEPPLDRILAIVRDAAPDKKIAILGRKRSVLGPIATALRNAQIPFQAVELEPLGQRPVVEDLMSLTRALLHPLDRIAWLALLRAPFCGLSLNDLHSLATLNSLSIWNSLENPPAQLSPDAHARLARIRAVLAEALSRIARASLRTVVEDTWRALGGPHCLDPAGLEDAEAFLALLDQHSTGGLLWDFAALRQRAGELTAHAGPTTGDHIQLMTIHKAKGLEFDIVIVPGMEQQNSSRDDALLRWIESGGSLIAGPVKAAGGDDDPIYKWIGEQQKIREDQELRRLTYVAATRPKFELHLLASRATGQNGLLRPRKNTLLKILESVFETHFDALSTATASAQAPAPPHPTFARVPASWTPPPFPPAPPWERRAAAMEPEPEVAYEWVGATARRCGEVVHAYLQRIAREGLDRWDAAAIARSHRAFAGALRNLGVPEDELPAAVARVARSLSTTLADDRGRWILSPHKEAATELALSTPEGNFRIDRTFLDPGGTRWIVDFKVSDHTGGSLDAFLDNERERHREQLERYARILASIDKRKTKLGLYFPLLGGWREWDAPEALGAPG
jgi:ATP-dependent helicase/nuclease subunit A